MVSSTISPERTIVSAVEAARLLGVTDSRIYQLIAEGKRFPLPSDGQYLLSASKEELRKACSDTAGERCVRGLQA